MLVISLSRLLFL